MALLSRKKPSGLALNVSTNVPQRACKNGILKTKEKTLQHTHRQTLYGK